MLTPDEVVTLTGKVRGAAQVRVLNHLGIDHKRRPDGSVVVLWENVRGGVVKSQKKRSEPNWAAI